MSERVPFPEDPFPLLERGTIEGIELIPWGSNYTFAALLTAEDGTRCYGVYKPRRGEVPLRDFPNGTLYKREVAAYVLSQHLGWDLVPPEGVARREGWRAEGSRRADLRKALRPLLSDHEWEALIQRWDRLLANPCFPNLDPYRNVPWPPF